MDIAIKLFEIIGGVLGTIITLVFFVQKGITPFFIRVKTLLTKDLFFRLTEQGELFFPKIIISTPIDVQITDCSFEINYKKNGSLNTSYECKAEQFGSTEKINTAVNCIPSSYFPKHSPDFILSKNTNKEILIRCSVISNKEVIQNSFKSLAHKLYNENAYRDPNNQSKLLHDINNCSDEILSNIKLEDGKHTLTCKINYQYRHLFFTIKKTSKSKIEMFISKDSLNLYKNKLSINDFIMDRLSSLNPQNKTINIRYPIISPTFE